MKISDGEDFDLTSERLKNGGDFEFWLAPYSVFLGGVLIGLILLLVCHINRTRRKKRLEDQVNCGFMLVDGEETLRTRSKNASVSERGVINEIEGDHSGMPPIVRRNKLEASLSNGHSMIPPSYNEAANEAKAGRSTPVELVGPWGERRFLQQLSVKESNWWDMPSSDL